MTWQTAASAIWFIWIVTQAVASYKSGNGWVLIFCLIGIAITVAQITAFAMEYRP